MTKKLVLQDSHIPKLPRHAKLRYDKAREIWIINAPERVVELDEIAGEIMQLVDGKSSVTIIVDHLSSKFSSASREQISKDVTLMLQTLADKGFIVI